MEMVLEMHENEYLMVRIRKTRRDAVISAGSYWLEPLLPISGREALFRFFVQTLPYDLGEDQPAVLGATFELDFEYHGIEGRICIFPTFLFTDPDASLAPVFELARLWIVLVEKKVLDRSGVRRGRRWNKTGSYEIAFMVLLPLPAAVRPRGLCAIAKEAERRPGPHVVKNKPFPLEAFRYPPGFSESCFDPLSCADVLAARVLVHDLIDHADPVPVWQMNDAFSLANRDVEEGQPDGVLFLKLPGPLGVRFHDTGEESGGIRSVLLDQHFADEQGVARNPEAAYLLREGWKSGSHFLDSPGKEPDRLPSVSGHGGIHAVAVILSVYP
jgi:hypothetical protein